MAHANPDPRAQAASALRQIADLIEIDHRIPAPTAGYIAAYLTTRQHLSENDRFSTLRQAAAALGAQVVEYDGCREARSSFGPFPLIIQASKDTVGPFVGGRVVPAEEDSQ